MKQFIARTIISLFTVFLFISCSPKEEFFEGYDFNSGDYVLYGLISEGDSTPLSNRVGDFIIRDTMVLNKIKQDWRIRLTDKRMPCGYTYIMILMKADSCVCHFAVNLECKYLAIEGDWYEFPPRLLNKYEKSLIRISRKEARDFQDTLINRNTFKN